MVEWHKMHVLCNVHVRAGKMDLARRCGVAGGKCLLVCVCVPCSWCGVVLSRGAGSSFGRAWCLVDVSFGGVECRRSVFVWVVHGRGDACVRSTKWACGLLGC